MKCYNIVKIDIDLPFTYFKNNLFDTYVDVMNTIYKKLYDVNIISVRLYPSNGLNTHIYIEIDKCLTFDKILILQFFSCSDHKRYWYNLQRMKQLNDPLDRLYPP